MKYIFVLIIILLVLIGCNKEVTTNESNIDGGDQNANNIKNNGANQEAEAIKKTCPATCDDKNSCTEDVCSTETEFICQNNEITPCCGNGKCEEGETFKECLKDCPNCYSDDKCKISKFNYTTQECGYEEIIPCCGNGKCEEGETYSDCSQDCIECTTSKKCFKSEYDYEKGACEEKPEVPCCGNGICDKGESCDSCDNDCKCEAKIDLGKYPSFLSSGTLIVVGDTAKSQDSFTASSFTTSLVVKGIESNSNLYSSHDSGDLKSKDLIVIGSPCDNSLWEEYQGVECDEDYFNTNEGMIKLIHVDDRQIVYVAGKTPEDTKKAAEFLNAGNNLDGMEVILDTSGSTAKII